MLVYGQSFLILLMDGRGWELVSRPTLVLYMFTYVCCTWVPKSCQCMVLFSKIQAEHPLSIVLGTRSITNVGSL